MMRHVLRVSAVVIPCVLAVGCMRAGGGVTWTPGEAAAEGDVSTDPAPIASVGLPEAPVGPAPTPVFDTAMPGAADETPIRDEPKADPVVVYDPAPPAPVADAGAETSYVVRKGDTLYGLARRFYSDHRKWRLIYEANRDTVPNPNLVKVGQVLTIPAVN